MSQIVSTQLTRTQARVNDIVSLILGSQWDADCVRELSEQYGVHMNVVRTEYRITQHVLDVIYDRRGQIARSIDAQLESITDLAAFTFTEQRTASPAVAVAALRAATAALDSRARNLGLGQAQRERSGEHAADQRAARAQIRELLREPPAWLADMLADSGWIRLTGVVDGES